jgi:hypothetical protein
MNQLKIVYLEGQNFLLLVYVHTAVLQKETVSAEDKMKIWNSLLLSGMMFNLVTSSKDQWVENKLEVF